MRREHHSHAESQHRQHSQHAAHVLEERIKELERDVVQLLYERDKARDLACRLEECAHLTDEQRDMLFKPTWYVADPRSEDG